MPKDPNNAELTPAEKRRQERDAARHVKRARQVPDMPSVTVYMSDAEVEEAEARKEAHRAADRARARIGYLVLILAFGSLVLCFASIGSFFFGAASPEAQADAVRTAAEICEAGCQGAASTTCFEVCLEGYLNPDL